jgi:hypothetical protein
MTVYMNLLYTLLSAFTPNRLNDVVIHKYKLHSSAVISLQAGLLIEIQA